MTQIDDVETCIACLESAGWDLSQAIEQFMGDSATPGEPLAATTAAERIVYPIVNHLPMEAQEQAMETQEKPNDDSSDNPFELLRPQQSAEASGSAVKDEHEKKGVGKKTALKKSVGHSSSQKGNKANSYLDDFEEYKERLIEFTISYRRKAGETAKEVIKMDDAKAVHDLYLECANRFNIDSSKRQLTLSGWDRFEPPTRNTKLRCLNLPLCVALKLTTETLTEAPKIELVITNGVTGETKKFFFNPTTTTIYMLKQQVHGWIQVPPSRQMWEGLPPKSNDQNLLEECFFTPSQQLTVDHLPGTPSPVRVVKANSKRREDSSSSLDGARAAANGAKKSETTNSDDDYEDEDYDPAAMHSDDEDLLLAENPNRGAVAGASSSSSSVVVSAVEDRLPLVPTDFGTTIDATHNFAVVFEARYGAQHPSFYVGAIEDAMLTANGGAGASARGTTPADAYHRRRPLLLYLHDDNAVAANVFAEQVLCSTEVCTLIDAQFVVWPWDLTQSENRVKLAEWIRRSIGEEGIQPLSSLPKDQFPLLLMVTKDKGRPVLLSLIKGNFNQQETMQELLTGLDHFQELNQAAMAEELDRVERERMKTEQESAYEASLAADQAKEEQRRRADDDRRREEEAKIKDVRDKQALLEALSAALPSEPPVDSPSVTTIRLRLPTGESKQRRFLSDAAASQLVDFAASLGYPSDTHRFFTSDVPKRELTDLDTSQSFKDLKFAAREQITVDER